MQCILELALKCIAQFSIVKTIGSVQQTYCLILFFIVDRSLE